jgi:hypothetical protein
VRSVAGRSGAGAPSAGPTPPEGGRTPPEGSDTMGDLAVVALTIALFGLLGLVLRGVERL